MPHSRHFNMLGPSGPSEMIARWRTCRRAQILSVKGAEQLPGHPVARLGRNGPLRRDKAVEGAGPRSFGKNRVRPGRRRGPQASGVFHAHGFEPHGESLSSVSTARPSARLPLRVGGCAFSKVAVRSLRIERSRIDLAPPDGAESVRNTVGQSRSHTKKGKGPVGLVIPAGGPQRSEVAR